eukprot:gnl/TRDRNA2_/TRDRNA2_174524_c1_seq1.p1 gnl/TRDRNA2_/TRDRNA2_174524_c1~~gnl/TRDRNA2_/TRDRNA2_174524_c1_seq1.p1  ORF type:complete len:603 (+),score=96.81 gnl/TRDRNA2_/TRDRNA2_174524_c1_seq1:43-1809(+)
MPSADPSSIEVLSTALDQSYVAPAAPPAVTSELKPRRRKKGTPQVEAVHAMTHFFLALVASTQSAGMDEQKLRRFIDEFRRCIPILAGVATGRLDQLVTGLKDLAGESEVGKAIAVVLDMLTLIGMDKTLYLQKFDMQTEVQSNLLPAVIERLFEHAKLDQNEELIDIVNRLINLMIGLCIDVSPDLINKQITGLIRPLETYAKGLLKGDERLERAGERLIESSRFIAAKAAGGKSLAQMKLFEPRGDGKPAPAVDILESILDLLLPFLPHDVRKPFFSILRTLSELSHLSHNPTANGFAKHGPVIVEQIAVALSVPQHTINGIFALAKGDWAGAADLCRPFCNIDPDTLEQMAKLLPTVRNTVTTGKDVTDRLFHREDLDNMAKDNGNTAAVVNKVANNVRSGKASTSDMFELIDLDHNGQVSVEEFRMLTKRLGFELNEHRILEIFSKCKKKLPVAANGRSSTVISASGDDEMGLNDQEFKKAFQYLEQKIAENSMGLLGRSWGRLMQILCAMIFILILLFVFITLGISAFVTGGAFGSVINSIMTISAGLGLSGKKAGGSSSASEDQSKISGMVEEVQETVFKDQ